MNDKELLELAAKAIGHKVYFNFVDRCQLSTDGTSSGYVAFWNPLESDGDALRLAVKLSLDIHIDINLTEVVYLDAITEAHLGDPYAATRRAIVRAAASIGGALK
jgi:hypothetical protein